MQPLPSARVELGRGKGNALVATRQQVQGQRRCGSVLREPYAGQRRVDRDFHHVHAGRGGNQAARTAGLVQSGQQQAGRSVQKLFLHQLLLGLRVVMGDADQGLEAGFVQGLLRRFQQIDEQSVGQRRDQHRHMVAALRRQRARRRVRHVGQALGGLEHTLDQGWGHGRLATQGAGSSHGADLGQPRHVGQRDPAAGAGGTGERRFHGFSVNPDSIWRKTS